MILTTVRTCCPSARQARADRQEDDAILLVPLRELGHGHIHAALGDRVRHRRRHARPIDEVEVAHGRGQGDDFLDGALLEEGDEGDGGDHHTVDVNLQLRTERVSRYSASVDEKEGELTVENRSFFSTSKDGLQLVSRTESHNQ